jgi:hypothetical protein
VRERRGVLTSGSAVGTGWCYQKEKHKQNENEINPNAPIPHTRIHSNEKTQINAYPNLLRLSTNDTILRKEREEISLCDLCAFFASAAFIVFYFNAKDAKQAQRTRRIFSLRLLYFFLTQGAQDSFTSFIQQSTADR